LPRDPLSRERPIFIAAPAKFLKNSAINNITDENFFGRGQFVFP